MSRGDNCLNKNDKLLVSTGSRPQPVIPAAGSNPTAHAHIVMTPGSSQNALLLCFLCLFIGGGGGLTCLSRPLGSGAAGGPQVQSFT